MTMAITPDLSELVIQLLADGVDTDDPAPMPETPEELRTLVEEHGVAAWRALLANIAVNPFGPDADRLAELARGADLGDAARAIDACTIELRRQFEDSERDEVAQEIRDLLALCGYSQRRFARYIGTSGPRLSTYVNGIVIPSATMMVRIRRCATELAAETEQAPG
jgi:hypothetical protein